MEVIKELTGWDVKSSVEDHIIRLEASPNIAEIGEKIRELTEELVMKSSGQEFQYALMLTPMRVVKQIRDQANTEVDRRLQEAKLTIDEEGINE